MTEGSVNVSRPGSENLRERSYSFQGEWRGDQSSLTKFKGGI